MSREWDGACINEMNEYEGKYIQRIRTSTERKREREGEEERERERMTEYFDGVRVENN